MSNQEAAFHFQIYSFCISMYIIPWSAFSWWTYQVAGSVFSMFSAFHLPGLYNKGQLKDMQVVLAHSEDNIGIS